MSDWTGRLSELATYRQPGADWKDVWALIVEGQRKHTSAWIEEKLWTWKMANWILSIRDDAATCRTCGGRIPGPTALSRYCSTGCRKSAHRCRIAQKPTAFGVQVDKAIADLKEVDLEISRAHRTLRRLQRASHAFTFPPDLTRLDHLPILPQRCGAGCERNSACSHTEGSVCLFAATGETRHHDD